MSLTHEVIGTGDLVSLSGRIVMANAAELRENIRRIIAKGSGRMLLDLSAVDFIDSSGLSVLISAHEMACEKNGFVMLSSPGPKIRALIELTRLHEMFEIFEDKNAACVRFN